MNRLGTESKMRVRERDRPSYNWQQRGVFVAGVAIVLLLAACATSTQLTPRHSPFAASRFLVQSLPRHGSRRPDGLKKLAEACTALEEAGVADESCHQTAERVIGDQKGRGVRG